MARESLTPDMRQFVVLGHDAPTDPDFSLDDLPGAGRLDLLCRCVASAFLLSHDLREDVRLFLVLGDEVTLRFEGEDLRYLSPDERNVASLIRTGLESTDEAVGATEVETTPGIHVSKRGLGEVLDGLDDPLLVLHAGGSPIVETDLPEKAAFVLSDHRAFADADLETLDGRIEQRVSVGPRSLHADDAIAIVHNYLDTDGYVRYAEA